MSRVVPAHVITDDSALGGSVIERSLRFNNNDSAYLNRTPGSESTRRAVTLSVWLKRCNFGEQMILDAFINDSHRTRLMIDAGNRMQFFTRYSGNDHNLITNAIQRDVSGWYHFVYAINTNESTASNRVKCYINGEQQTFTGSNYPDQEDLMIGAICNHTIGVGQDSGGNEQYFDGYMAEMHCIDGTQLDPTYFGYTDSQTGLWRPKKYTYGNYGTNGFYLNFKDNSSTSALGKDTSGNGNNFTVNNLAVTDSVIDTPSNNFATWNAVDGEGKDNASSFSEGSLKVQIAYQGNAEESGATLAFSSGKWYWEEYMQSSTDNSGNVGVGVKSVEGHGNNGGNHWRVRGNGGESDHNGSQTNVSGLSWTNGDIIGIAVDMDAGTWTVSKNGTFIGANIHTNLSGTVVPTMHNSNGGERHTFITNFGQDSSFAGTKTAQGNKDANGIGDFYYPVPSGYKALCSKNLPPNSPSIIRPQKHFETLLYTGTGSSNSVTGLEFSPDLIWVKRRDTDGHHHLWVDTIRGGTKSLSSNLQDAENSNANRDMTFLANGIRWNSNTGNANASGGTYAVWCWKAGGTAVSNSDGAIASSVSVNTEVGFSMVGFQPTAQSTTVTVGHGLGATPDWIVVKSRGSSANWDVFHSALGSSKKLYLNGTNAQIDSGAWGSTDPTSSVFSFNPGNQHNNNHIAYCWTAIPGFSAFGKYTGNGNADGPFINLGFRPAWIMFKLADGGADDWPIYDIKRDPINVCDHRLFANTDTAEGAVGQEHFDILSNGIKFKKQKNPFNNSGKVYVYMAFAEQPGTTPFGTFPNAR